MSQTHDLNQQQKDDCMKPEEQMMTDDRIKELEAAMHELRDDGYFYIAGILDNTIDDLLDFKERLRGPS